jgi:hypothetical protein
MKLYSPFLFFIAIIFITGCKKEKTPTNTTPNNPPTAVDVYVGGFEQINSTPIACYWKNGAEYRVNDGTTYSIATSIAVHGTDVYIAGYIALPSGITQATYWKNGVAINLTKQGISKATAMAINGSDIYVIGFIQNLTSAGQYLVCWKNGIADTISAHAGYPTGSAIAINGSDVYIAGTTSIDASGDGELATFWKNGALSILDNISYSNAYAIAFNGADVYIAGVLGAGLNTTLVYWKNGILNNVVQTGELTVSSIIVHKNDIYIGGSTYNGGSDTTATPVATYWKNGVATSLAKSSLTSYVLGMAINGTDVYASGGVGRAVADVTPLATYWKNGVPATLSTNLSWGYAIALVPQK